MRGDLDVENPHVERTMWGRPPRPSSQSEARRHPPQPTTNPSKPHAPIPPQSGERMQPMEGPNPQKRADSQALPKSDRNSSVLF